MDSIKPLKFGKYILLDKIAIGGMAELYRAKLTGVKGFEKLIAIKRILPHLTNEESLISSFIDEAKLAAYLQHPNIVQIYDFGKIEGAYFLAMEYLFGKDLKLAIGKSEMTNIPFTLEDALYITSRVCDGLYYAHNLTDHCEKPLNIIHRDIGPQNVFITYDGQIKIIDFGIAKAAIQNTTTQSDLIKGKISYMSPEQAQGQEIDHRSDIFSIGILLYELVTHQRMFEGDHYQIYDKVCKAAFEPAESVAPDLPTDLYEILHRALAGNPGERYQSADEMALDLEKCISHLSYYPTDKILSQFMIGLFEKEAEDEKTAMREAALYEPGNVLEFLGTTSVHEEKTLAHDTKGITERNKNKAFLYGILILLLTIIGSFFILIENEAFFDPGHDSDSKNIASAQPPLSSNPMETLSVIELTEYGVGKRLVEEKRFSEAVNLFEETFSEDASKKESLSVLYSEALNGQADELVEAHPEKSKSIFLKSLKINPDNSTAYYQLGRIYTKEKKYEEALASYEKAIELGTDIAGVYFNVGYIYYAVKEEYVPAQEMYERTVELSPTFLDEALFNLALAQNKLGKKQQCIQNLGKAISVNPDNKQAKDLLDRLI